jgi:hypothetical protein
LEIVAVRVGNAFLGSFRHDILLENKPRALQMLTAYTLVAINIISIFICYDIAKNRRGNTRFWGLMGVFFGPVAIPFALFCKPKKQE